MNILLIGGGGREHCLAWKIVQSPKCDKLYIAPGNAGTALVGENVSLPDQAPFIELIAFTRDNKIDLVVVGPEAPLVDGLADALVAAGVNVFGPQKDGAMLEGSKDFAKDLMTDANIPTAAYRTFSDCAEAEAYLDQLPGPYVLKADGLASGKGVSIHQTAEEAKGRLQALINDKLFKEASTQVVIEEFLEGQEASVLAFVDGETVLAMEAAQDHKQINEGDTGPNTGGMGAYSPTPVVDEAMARAIEEQVLKPCVAELRKRGIHYVGVLYAGLMITKDGPKVIEFNCRLGDPETQCVLPRLKSDLVELMEACCDGRLNEMTMEWDPRTAIGVVAASLGYPGAYAKGMPISGLDKITDADDRMVFYAGAKHDDAGNVVTSGGRVLCLTALDDGLRSAQSKCYELLDQLHFDGLYCRRDIGFRVLD
jgi:phosphoribosylamine--glycine ligase